MTAKLKVVESNQKVGIMSQSNVVFKLSVIQELMVIYTAGGVISAKELNRPDEWLEMLCQTGYARMVSKPSGIEIRLTNLGEAYVDEVVALLR